MVSIKGPIIATILSSDWFIVFAAECAIDAEPTPPSLLKTPLIPVTSAPIKPPYVHQVKIELIVFNTSFQN